MFGFDRDEDGSEERFRERPVLWEESRHGALYHYAWWIVHNLIAHPLIAVLPLRPLFRFHDWTSHHMHNKKTPRGSS